MNRFVADTNRTHERKLLKLGIHKPNFIAPSDVIFNFSNYVLSRKEELLLALGLDFCLPNYKPKYTDFFLAFEVFFHNIRQLPSHINLEIARRSIQNLAHKTYSSLKHSNWFPFLKYEDFQVLKKLSKRNDLVICRPDKGKGVVLLNRDDYVEKMNNILSDSSKFVEVGSPEFGTILKIEDRINRTLKQLKDDSAISDCTYNSLFSSGSSFSTLYGLPKVHKENIPLRPILAAYNSPNFHIAKFLVPLLSHLTSNRFSLHNSSSFVPDILEQNTNSFMVSFDVQSLFTNGSIFETINIIPDKLYPTPKSIHHDLNKK